MPLTRGFWFLVYGCWCLVFVFWMFGFWCLVFGVWFSVVGFWFSAFSGVFGLCHRTGPGGHRDGGTCASRVFLGVHQVVMALRASINQADRGERIWDGYT